MSKPGNIFENADCDAALDELNARCEAAATARGMRLKNLVVIADEVEGVSVSMIGCNCQACKARMVIELAEAFGATVEFGEPSAPARVH